MSRWAGYFAAMIVGAVAQTAALWWALESPWGISLAIYPLPPESAEEPLRVHWWTPLPGSQDGLWRSWPVCPPPAPTTPEEES